MRAGRARRAGRGRRAGRRHVRRAAGRAAHDLVVDDSAVSAKLLIAKLSAAGHATELAENGRVGARAAARPR